MQIVEALEGRVAWIVQFRLDWCLKMEMPRRNCGGMCRGLCAKDESAAEAAALQDIGLMRAWSANANSDKPNRSGLTNRPHNYRHVGWLGVGGGGCLQQSSGEVRVLLFWGEGKRWLLAN